MTATNPSITTGGAAVNLSSPEGLLRGAGLMYVTTIVQLGGRFALTLLIAQVLGATGLGVFSLAFVTVQALVMLATNGQDWSVLKFVSPAHKMADRASVRVYTDAALLTTLGSALVLMLGMILVFPSFVFNSSGLDQARDAAPWFAPAVVLQTATAILSALGLACGRPIAKALPEKIFGTLTQLVVTGALLWLGWGLRGVVVGFLLANLISLLATIWLIRDLYPLRVPILGLGVAIRKMFGYSWKLGVGSAINYALLNAALLVLGTANAAQAGLYAAASRMTLLGLLFLDSFASTFGPHAAAKMNEPSLEQDLQRVTVWMTILSAPIYIVLFGFAAQWMNILGPEFSAGTSVLMVLALAQMLNMLTGNAGLIVTLSNRPGLRVFNIIAAWGANLVLILLLAPLYGALGAAFAYLTAIVITDLLEYVETRFLFGMSPWSRSMLKPLLVIASGAGALWLSNSLLHPDTWFALLLSLVFVLGYVLVMWFVGLSPADTQMVKRAAHSFPFLQDRI